MYAVLYVKPGCVKCRLTDRKLKVPHRLQKLTQEDITRFKNAGKQSTPIVQVFNSKNDLLDSWEGFDFEKIKKWNGLLENDK